MLLYASVTHRLRQQPWQILFCWAWDDFYLTQHISPWILSRNKIHQQYIISPSVSVSHSILPHFLSHILMLSFSHLCAYLFSSTPTSPYFHILSAFLLHQTNTAQIQRNKLLKNISLSWHFSARSWPFPLVFNRLLLRRSYGSSCLSGKQYYCLPVSVWIRVHTFLCLGTPASG